jgi:hypothetical protein
MDRGLLPQEGINLGRYVNRGEVTELEDGTEAPVWQPVLRAWSRICAVEAREVIPKKNY